MTADVSEGTCFIEPFVCPLEQVWHWKFFLSFLFYYLILEIRAIYKLHFRSELNDKKHHAEKRATLKGRNMFQYLLYLEAFTQEPNSLGM